METKCERPVCQARAAASSCAKKGADGGFLNGLGDG